MLRHWEGETGGTGWGDRKGEGGEEGRRKGGGYPHTIRHSYITYSKDMSWGRGEEGGGGRSGEEEEKNEKETETAGERKRKREGGKGVGQGWVYPTTPLLPSPLPPNDREAVSAL